MSDKPILFSSPMVRALLDGRKTQTRRVIKPQPSYIESSGRWHWPIPKSKQHGCDAVVTASREWHEYLLAHQRPWHAVGDRLWARETWRAHGWHGDCVEIAYAAQRGLVGWSEQHEQIRYPNGDRNAFKYYAPKGPDFWRPSLFMPRWASRLTLTVTDVRIERLEDISEDDAIAEGVVDMGRRDGEPYAHCVIPDMPDILMEHDAVPVYAQLWEKINGEGAWQANPWVVAYTFTVHRGNIDEVSP